MPPAEPNHLRHHLLVGDIIALAAGWGSQVALQARTAPAAVCAAIAIACTMMAMARAGLYRSRVCAMRSVEVLRVIGSCLVGAGTFALTQWLAGSLSLSGPFLGAAIAAGLLILHRWRFSRWLKARRLAGHYLRPVVLVGTNQDALALWTMLKDEPELGYRVVAVAGPPRRQAPWEGLPTSALTEDLGALAAQAGATGVIIVLGGLDAGVRSEALQQALASHLHVQLWTGISDVSHSRVRTVPVSGIPLLYVEPHNVPEWQLVVKRALDLLVATAAGLVTGPLMLGVALLIKLEDGGPAIYRHRVVGRRGAPITVFKLRTMVPDASKMLGRISSLNERTGGPLFKASDDPRVTRVGRILRATSIDELPQLWNVLNGTMSVVGPRFALPSEVEHFDQELRHRRQNMRPGITGLWQSESRDNPSFSAYRRLDLFYVENWSLALDMSILVNTLYAVSTRALRGLLTAAARTSRDLRSNPDPVQPDREARETTQHAS
jgi:exopolysaccharide biosynthesis polyprenyl glycosylphosphotransferase